jgi:hypothetical protein
LKINQSVVAKYLESKNWEKTKILSSFAEIKSNLI